jgi:glycosyltransferase involved in cell wall biosynthesis
MPTEIVKVTASEFPIGLSVVPIGLSVVVPVYNSQGSLPLLVQRLHPVLESIGTPYELVLVNDGSRDESWRVVQELAQRHGWIRGYCLMRNFGQHNALLCGIRQARFAICVTMDDDLQNPPEEIPGLLKKLKEGFDLVYGTPARPRQGWIRNFFSWGAKIFFEYALGAGDSRKGSSFRIFHTRLREAFQDYSGSFVSIDILLTWGLKSWSYVLVHHDQRKDGVSGYNLRRQFTHAVNIITTFSVRPLQFASYVGFCFTIFGVIVLAWTIGRFFLSGGSVPGFPFLASVIAIFSGAQLFSLGIIGEYLARMHFRLLDRPSYVIQEKCANQSPKNP